MQCITTDGLCHPVFGEGGQTKTDDTKRRSSSTQYNSSDRTFVVQASQDIESVERKASSVVQVRAQHVAHGFNPHGPALLRLVASYQVLISRTQGEDTAAQQ